MEREKLISLVSAVQQGDQQAANELYTAVHQGLYYYISKTVNDPELAQDLLQETFIEIYQTIDKLNEPAAFLKWSRQIAYHKCTAYSRKTRDVLLEENEDGQTIFDTIEEDRTEFIPDEALDKAELKKTIHDMLAALPMEQRSAIMLRYFDEISVKEIAEIQGVSEGTIKSRLNYGRKSLQKSVEDYEKKNGVKLRCAGVIPLLLWLFAHEASAASAASTASAAAGTVPAVVAGGVKRGAKAAGKFTIKKLIAGIVAAAVVAGGITAAVLPQDEPEPPITEQQPSSNNDNANNETNQNGTNNANGNTVSKEPSEEIQKMMNKYDVFATKLKNYANGEEIFCYISDEEELVGREALTYIYEQLSDMEELDAWYGTEWMPKDDPDTEWNRQKLLAGFTVLENQLLKQSCVVTGKTEDNKTYNNAYVWEYNPDGTIANVGFVDMLHNELYPFWLEIPSQLFFELYRRDGKDYYESTCSISYGYDENGRLTQIKRHATIQEKTKFTVEMEYDANGNLVKANSINEEGQKINYSFTYDAQGRLTQVEADSNTMYAYCFKYTYNENGQLLQADGYDEKGLSRSYKYTYDADGKLTNVEYDDSWKTWPESGKVEVAFTYDDQGRPATATYSEGVFSLKNGNTYEYSKVEFQYVYGDYCTYTPAK